MKTAISIPDNLFKIAEKTAKRLGIPRSRLFAKALEEYLNTNSRKSTTEKLNEIYPKHSNEQKENSDLSVEMLRISLKNDSWLDLVG